MKKLVIILAVATITALAVTVHAEPRSEVGDAAVAGPRSAGVGLAAGGWVAPGFAVSRGLAVFQPPGASWSAGVGGAWDAVSGGAGPSVAIAARLRTAPSRRFAAEIGLAFDGLATWSEHPRHAWHAFAGLLVDAVRMHSFRCEVSLGPALTVGAWRQAEVDGARERLHDRITLGPQFFLQVTMLWQQPDVSR